MSRHQHHHHNHPHSSSPAKPKGIHKNPWLIAGVVLMLIAMVVYVMTMDESVEPAVVPAAPVTAAP